MTAKSSRVFQQNGPGAATGYLREILEKQTLPGQKEYALPQTADSKLGIQPCNGGILIEQLDNARAHRAKACEANT
jgi:hypothetical protein